MNTESFYDDLADSFHLIFADWQASIDRQAANLDAIIRNTWGGNVLRIHDVACGIGTQSLGLAKIGYDIRGSDISPRSIERARREASARGLFIKFSVHDMLTLDQAKTGPCDLIIACDNSIPHLLTDAAIEMAFRTFRRCLLPGGGCLITIRDYANEPRDAPTLRPYGVHKEGGARRFLFQEWEWEGDQYTLSLYLVTDENGACNASVTRSRYYAITIDRLMELMSAAGFTDVRRIDDAFYQPVIVGTNPGG